MADWPIVLKIADRFGASRTPVRDADLRPHSARLRVIAHSQPDRLEVSLKEHLAMNRAIVEHDPGAAVAACTEHLNQTQKTILDAVLNPNGAVPLDIVIVTR